MHIELLGTSGVGFHSLLINFFLGSYYTEPDSKLVLAHKTFAVSGWWWNPQHPLSMSTLSQLRLVCNDNDGD